MPRRRTTKTPRKPLSLYPATMAILAICVVIQVLSDIYPELSSLLCLTSYQPWGLITYQFAHAGWMHLLGNFMFGLPFMASLEHNIGSKRLVIWYVLSGCLSALLFGFIAGFDGGLIGASGSLSGMAMAACLTFGKCPLDKAIAFLLGMTLLSIQVILAIELSAFTQVAYWGHVGGMLAGILLVLGDSWEMPLKKLSR